MRILYSILFYLLSPLILLRLYWKSQKLPAYRKRLKERFGLNPIKNKVDVWLHAVSLGEVVAAFPLIEAFLSQDKKVLVTTMTPTGSEHLIKKFGEKITHQYIPYDLNTILKRFFKHYAPKLGIIMETELWPNLIHQAHQSKIPLFLVNARISDKAYKSYLRTTFFFKSVVNKITQILAQSEQDANRFIAIGADRHKVSNCGNIKFDIKLNTSVKDEVILMKERWGKERPVLIAASTHEGEEKLILSHLRKLHKIVPDLILLIAPRHPERFQSVFDLSKELGFDTHFRSDFNGDSQTEVIIINSLGELLSFYKMANYAFVGGSLVPIGGHNVLEPIALEVPVLTGPYMHNSREIFDELRSKQAIEVVKDGDGLVNVIAQLITNPKQKEKLVGNASTVLRANQGTLGRILQSVKGFI